MPTIYKNCKVPWCPRVHDNTHPYCDGHKKLAEKYRPNSSKRLYDSKWRKARTVYLANNPLCKECERKGKTSVATELDHITPHRGDKKLFWDKSNLQGLCNACHVEKTGKGL